MPNLEEYSRIEWIDDGESIHIVPTPLNPIKELRGKYVGKNLSNALALHRFEERVGRTNIFCYTGL